MRLWLLLFGAHSCPQKVIGLQHQVKFSNCTTDERGEMSWKAQYTTKNHCFLFGLSSLLSTMSALCVVAVVMAEDFCHFAQGLL
jgi:hypothetical protein